MTKVVLTLMLAIFTVASAFAQAESPGQFVVSVDTLNVRLASNASGKVAKKLYQGQKVEVFDVSNGWARISEYYDGASIGFSGNVAQWVFARHLSALPAKKTEVVKVMKVVKVDVNSAVYQAIKSSDDLDRYQGIFVTISEQLVEAGQCKLSDFHDIGGWWRSAAHNPRSVYYTYCGGASNDHRIFVDTATGQTFR